MREVEPGERRGGEVEPRRVPQVVVPIPLEDARGFLHDALKGTSVVDPAAQVLSGWALLEPQVRFSPVDATHTRIEIDVTGPASGAEALLFVQRRGEIDRFFVAIQDELDRRRRWRPESPEDRKLLDSLD